MESFVLDAPLYKRKIVVVQKETIVHSDDFDAPGRTAKIFQFNLTTVVDKS